MFSPGTPCVIASRWCCMRWMTSLAMSLSPFASDLYPIAGLDFLQPGFALLSQVVVQLGLRRQPRLGIADLDGACGHQLGLRGWRGWGRRTAARERAV